MVPSRGFGWVGGWVRLEKSESRCGDEAERRVRVKKKKKRRHLLFFVFVHRGVKPVDIVAFLFFFFN